MSGGIRIQRWTDEIVEYATYLYVCRRTTLVDIIDLVVSRYGSYAKVSYSNASSCIRVGKERHKDLVALAEKFDGTTTKATRQRHHDPDTKPQPVAKQPKAPRPPPPKLAGREGLEQLRDLALGKAQQAYDEGHDMDFAKLAALACKLQDSVTKTKTNAANQGHIVEQRGLAQKLKEIAKSRAAKEKTGTAEAAVYDMIRDDNQEEQQS